MREAAEDAETEQFNPAIAAASGDEGKPLLSSSVYSNVCLDVLSD